ncbi:MAG TPA: hypothetical protein VK641_12995 [Terriglobales bacterium]|nr:hypothetical protein [Terriglobales bacterium]
MLRAVMCRLEFVVDHNTMSRRSPDKARQHGSNDPMTDDADVHL